MRMATVAYHLKALCRSVVSTTFIYRLKKKSWTIFSTVILIAAGLNGCASIGPGTVARDRFDYIAAISDSWKSQMLLNLVKLRYGDAPVFLDIASVISQYGIEGSVGFSGSWAQNPQVPWPYTALYNWLGAGRYVERPTITYSPLSGEKFARNLMTPIPPAAILNLLQGGYPVDLVLRLCVHSINGVHTRFGSGARARQADPEFYQLAEKLRSIQQSGDLGLRVRKTGEQTATMIVFSKKPSPEVAVAAFELSVHLFRQLGVILAACRLVGLVMPKVEQPPVVSEMIAGILRAPGS